MPPATDVLPSLDAFAGDSLDRIRPDCHQGAEKQPTHGRQRWRRTGNHLCHSGPCTVCTSRKMRERSCSSWSGNVADYILLLESLWDFFPSCRCTEHPSLDKTDYSYLLCQSILNSCGSSARLLELISCRGQNISLLSPGNWGPGARWGLRK